MRPFKYSAVLLALGCGSGSAPYPTTPAALAQHEGGQILPRDQWRIVGPVRPSDPPLACDSDDCANRWLTDSLPTNHEGGSIHEVIATPTEFIIVVTEHHSCGAYLPEYQWRVWLPLPRRPLRTVDFSTRGACNRQP